MWPLIESPNRYTGRRRSISRIGIHTTQTTDNSAPGVAAHFSQRSIQASAHVVVDRDEVICCVKWIDTAWAMPHVNADGFHIELCGMAQWSHDDWLFGPGLPVIQRGALVAAEAVTLFRFLGANFEIRELTDYEVIKGSGAGFIRHSTASRLLKPNAGHWDPGPGFPMEAFFDMVNWWMPRVNGTHFR